MIGEGPAPLCLRMYMLAAGINGTGGLGARAIYGDRTLTWREFEEAWLCQQTILKAQSSEEGSREVKSDAGIRRTLELEKDGKLDAYEANPDLQRPDWLPLDPYAPDVNLNN